MILQTSPFGDVSELSHTRLVLLSQFWEKYSKTSKILYLPPLVTSSVPPPEPSRVAEAHLPGPLWFLHMNQLLSGTEEKGRDARELNQVQR